MGTRSDRPDAAFPPSGSMADAASNPPALPHGLPRQRGSPPRSFVDAPSFLFFALADAAFLWVSVSLHDGGLHPGM